MVQRKKSSNSVRSIKERAKIGRSFDPNSKNFKLDEKEGANAPPKLDDEDWLDRPGAPESKTLPVKTKKKKGKKGSANGGTEVIKNVLSKFAGQIPDDPSLMPNGSAIPKLTADDWMPGCFQEGPPPVIKVSELDAAVAASTQKKKKVKKNMQTEEKTDKLQGRQEGESYNAFRRRINQETRAKLQEQSKRVLGEGRVAKRQKRQGVLKTKKAFKKESIQAKLNPIEDELHTTEKVAFGDVVERPPELAIRKTFEKHKKGEKPLLGGKLGAFADAQKGGKVGGGSDVAGYADRIKDAYRALKKKRRQNEADEP
eukprot:gnl/MRDRNA2_/MRDRNA2_51204_c0_seq1.p1 gnl/MRDRNA2_/MRDRNA2_51204_c0~~gnl/MRDRNA2_/MRDRNA2_51204_c0_seq1.p1  ORF type:complete len:313 (+),score=95.61 gnl/MRDRNA2_/MRDRNA2_51204_c0_seq1:67-1005(+)